ncbi:MAG: pyridoxal phosphate-dependent aminotransferase [Geminicoccaceae bacterium]
MAAANERASVGGDVLHLEVGQPGGSLPQPVRDAVDTAMARSCLGYTEALGQGALRRAIADLYRDWYGETVDWRRIVVTTGASGAFILAFLAAFDAGARVGVTEPGYPAYRNILKALDLEPMGLRCAPETGFRADLAVVGNRNLNGLVLASPANPTGTTIDDATLQAIARHCRDEATTLVMDEIYHGLFFHAGGHGSLVNQDGVFVVNSFSKFFGLTGWRIGWLVVPDGWLETVDRLAQNLFISPPHVAQVAALASLDCQGVFRRRVETYRRNAEMLMAALAAGGLDSFVRPDGAFYVYANTERLGHPSSELCRLWLAEIAVAAAPGLDFDRIRGEDYVRFSVAGDERDVARAGERLSDWLSRHAGPGGSTSLAAAARN